MACHGRFCCFNCAPGVHDIYMTQDARYPIFNNIVKARGQTMAPVLRPCRWYVADGQAKALEEVSTSDRELSGGAARIGRPEELFGSASSSKRKRPSRHRVIMLRGVVRTPRPPESLLSLHSARLLMLAATPPGCRPPVPPAHGPLHSVRHCTLAHSQGELGMRSSLV